MGSKDAGALAVSWPAASVLIQFPAIPPLALDMVCPPVLWWVLPESILFTIFFYFLISLSLC